MNPNFEKKKYIRWLKHLVLTKMKRLIQISFWEEVIVYNAKKKNDDIQIKKNVRCY